MRIIPAIDIIDGKCVRLTKGDYSTKKIYNENPLDVAKEYQDTGIQYLHLVDLDGAKAKKIVNYKTLESICKNTDLNVDFGGGLRSEEDVKTAFDYGAHQITGGSIAVKSPELFEKLLENYGPKKIILGADALNGQIAVNGWTEYSDNSVIDFIKMYELKKIQYVVCTDISKDGMLKGPSFELYTEILYETGIKLIASGGIRSMQDLDDLKDMGCEGAIIGKAIYENKISLTELRELC
jgi:phosphoribosylformimino-5-aminoimidazole carboxamide ribotide isomerase